MATELTEKAYNELLEMIVRKKLKPGDRLPSEMVLCKKLDVSRNTLRAALNKMKTLGFTVSQQGGGTYVKKVDSEVYLNFFVPALLTHNLDLLMVMQFRKGIEVEASRLAAYNATDEDTAEMESLLKRCKETLKRDSQGRMSEFASANTDLHIAISKSSHNTMFLKMMEIISMMILPEMQDFLEAQGDDIDSTFYHEMVLRCIIAHKPEEAAFFMDRHMCILIRRVEEYVKQNGKTD